jgi:hypothetical protein
MDGGFVLAFQSIALFVFVQSLSALEPFGHFTSRPFAPQSLIASSPHGLFPPSLIASKPQGLFSPSLIASSPQSLVPDAMSGTASIAVRVVDDATNRPIKGATVTAVVISNATDVKYISTDRNGRALLLGLAKGRVRVSAWHPGYVSMTYGAERPGEDGTYITIADQQQIPAVTLRLKRGAVIAGTVTNEAGEPLVGLEVQAFRRTLRNGQAVFANALEASDRTDDRGTYRITNLSPGDYVIGVIPYLVEETIQLDEVETADARMNRGDLFRLVESTIPVVTLLDLGRDRAGLSVLSGPTPSALGQDRAIGYGPTFYPGAAASTATVVRLAPAEKRDGLDIRLEPMTLVRVEGRLAGFDENAVARAVVTLVAAGNNGQVAIPPQLMASTDSNGVFRFSLVPRGQYLLNVRAKPVDPGRIPMWASMPISVGDAAITDVLVPLNGGLKVTGQVRFTSSRVEGPIVVKENGVATLVLRKQ